MGDADDLGIGRAIRILVAHAGLIPNAVDGLARGHLARQETLHATADHEGMLVLQIKTCENYKIGACRIAHGRHCDGECEGLSMIESVENSEIGASVNCSVAANVSYEFCKKGNVNESLRWPE